MATFLIVLITIILSLAAFLLIALAVVKYHKDLISLAMEISCYLDTYHYMDDEETRVSIGQEKFYQTLFGNKVSKFRKEKTDFIFWKYYTQWFSQLLEIIPICLNRESHRCLADGETVNIQKYLDQTQDIRLAMYGAFATEEEMHRHLDNCENVSIINEKNSDK